MKAVPVTYIHGGIYDCYEVRWGSCLGAPGSPRADGVYFPENGIVRDEVANNTALYDATNTLSEFRFVCADVGRRGSNLCSSNRRCFHKLAG